MIPLGLSLNNWIKVFTKGGFLKWLILRILNNKAQGKISTAKLKTNKGFAGILFTGCMVSNALAKSFEQLTRIKICKEKTRSILLIHPSAKLNNIEEIKKLSDFHLSSAFLKSNMRQKEWMSIKQLKDNI